MDEHGCRDIDQVDKAEGHRDLLPCPVPARQDDPEHHDDDNDDRYERRDTEDTHRGCHADEFRDDGQPVHERQVEEGEPAPERAETTEDRLCMPVLGNSPEAHRHLLDEIRNRPEKDEEPDKTVPEFCTGCRVGGYPASIVVRDHHDHAGPCEQQVDLDSLDDFAVVKIKLR